MGSKERILQLAVAAIEDGGEAAVRVKAIADEAEVAITSIYHFYGDREGLVQAAQVARFAAGYREGAEVLRQVAESCQSREELRDALHTLIRTVFSSTHTEARARRSNVVGSAVTRPALREVIIEEARFWINDLCESLAIAQRRGFIDADAPIKELILAHVIAVNGLYVVELSMDADDVVRWRDHYVNQVFANLGLAASVPA